MKSHWLTGKDGYNFKVNDDVCIFIPKKVGLINVLLV